MKKYLLAASAATLVLAAPALAQGKGHGQGHGGGHGQDHGGGGKAHVEMKQGKGHGDMRGPMAVKVENKGHGRDVVRIEKRDSKDRDHDRRIMLGDNDRGLIAGCPPGLAKKGNGCMPPGQAKKMIGAAVPATIASAMLDGPYRNWYRDDNRYYYRMQDGVIYRVARENNLVNALFPAYSQPYDYLPLGGYYPADYNYYNVPYQYQRYYPDGGNSLYRYSNGAIYGLDPKTMAIQSIVALLAGDLSVGQRLPSNYSVYNVPMAYRSQYYDTNDAWYRYNDGYVYRVDPKTQLITAVIDALV